METTVKIKLSSGKELELTLVELEELKKGFIDNTDIDNTGTDYTKWYPVFPYYPYYPYYPSSPWSTGDVIYTTDLRISNTSGKDDKSN